MGAFVHSARTASAQHAQRRHSTHSTHFTRRIWGNLEQLAILLPIQAMLHPHNPMFHPTPTSQATPGPELRP